LGTIKTVFTIWKSGTYFELHQIIQSAPGHPPSGNWEMSTTYHPEWFGGSLDDWYETLREAATAQSTQKIQTTPSGTAHGEVPDAEFTSKIAGMALTSGG
jgi:hypothetical protein